MSEHMPTESTALERNPHVVLQLFSEVETSVACGGFSSVQETSLYRSNLERSINFM